MTKSFRSFLQLVAVIGLVGLSILACSKTRRLNVYPHPADDIDVAEIYNAPVVVVGYILQDDNLGIEKYVDWNHQRHVDFALHRARVKIENVLVGRLSSGTQDVYYFTFGGAYNGPVPLGRWDISGLGQLADARRRILFCKWDNGLLRLACDGTNNCTDVVASGRHSDNPALKNADLRRKIAYIQLTKGEGVSNHQFANNLTLGCRFLQGCWTDLPELKELMHSANPEIKFDACELLLEGESQLLPRARDQEIQRICKGLVRKRKY